MNTDEINMNLSNNAYYINSKDKVREVDHVYYYSDKNKKLGKFKVLAVENNKDNGMQAMAVAPVDSNEKVEVLQKLNNQIKRV